MTATSGQGHSLARTTRCGGGADEDAGSKAVGALAPHSACARAAGDEKGPRSPSERAQGSRVLHDLSPATGAPPWSCRPSFCPSSLTSAQPRLSQTHWRHLPPPPRGRRGKVCLASLRRRLSPPGRTGLGTSSRREYGDGVCFPSVGAMQRPASPRRDLPAGEEMRPPCPPAGARPAAQVSTRRPACVRGAATLSPGVTSRPAGPRQTSEIYMCGTGGNSWPRGRPRLYDPHGFDLAPRAGFLSGFPAEKAASGRCPSTVRASVASWLRMFVGTPELGHHAALGRTPHSAQRTPFSTSVQWR